MDYRLPQAGDEALLRDYVREHAEHGERSISASMGLAASDVGEWIARMRSSASTGEAGWGRSLLYLCFDGTRLVGLLSIRYELPAELSAIYGDIGYGVRPTERRKGYATAMLRHALSVCGDRGMKQVILGCYRDNAASAATIRRSGGVLFAENDNYTKGRISQYYLITLNRLQKET